MADTTPTRGGTLLDAYDSAILDFFLMNPLDRYDAAIFAFVVSQPLAFLPLHDANGEGVKNG